MGYGIMPYSIDLGFIKTCYGVEDEGVKNQLLQKTSANLSSIDSQLEVEDGWEPALNIMQDFLNGIIKDAGDGAKNWYVLEVLIKTLGETCNNSNWYPADIDPFYSIKEFMMYTIDLERKINLPMTMEFPAVFTIYRTDFSAALAAIKNAAFEESQIKQFADWIAYSNQKKQDLVLFYY
ncbi:hypothetical protein EI427_16630 [Flammeovirga pectinis]|uniref:DUF7691 domain-containing protein n=1 Tax=Flammeovirga pectinis TaxID=2494373 RepID=A0A3Q9FQ31_9BACT|nr:hypothetical protein [Flammeovirga pectinis]AZQ63791.1 hypothetical protein EI427_16630 [Flammeovirga pectinis]